MGKHYLLWSVTICIISLTWTLLISDLSVDAEQQGNDDLRPPHLPSSLSPAASEDPSDNPLNDIFSIL